MKNESGYPEDPLEDSSIGGQKIIHFSSLLTTVCSVLCMVGIGLVVWSVSLSDGFRMSPSTSRDLDRLASRLLEFEARFSELSTFEQAMYQLGGQISDTQKQILYWYEESGGYQSDPIKMFYVGVLQGEAGLTPDLTQLLNEWEGELFPFSVFRRILEITYLDHETTASDNKMLQAHLAEEIPGNWFYYHIAHRLAVQGYDENLRNSLQIQFYELTEPQLRRWRALIVFEFGVIGVGFVSLCWLRITRFKNREIPRNGRIRRDTSAWSFEEGMAVFVRGGAVTILCIGLVALVPNGQEVVESYGFLLLYVPPVVIAYILLWKPKSLSPLSLFGMLNFSRQLRKWMPVLLAVMALGLLGDWVIMIGGGAIQNSVHWTEWFVPQLVWGEGPELIKTICEFVLVAPLFEELIFRGILFTTLRAKFNVPVSMVGSALVFALAHGYGLIAFLTVFLSGLLWAWAYEKTGSLIPGMIAHGLNNGLVVYSLIAFFR